MRLSLILIVLFFSSPASAADLPIPDLGSSWVQVDPGQFVITPAGNGPSLADRGVVVQLWLRDNFDQPVAHYPAEDIWLYDSGTADLSLCQGGSIADADTDAEGYTTISHSIAGGGWTQSGLSCYVSGNPIAQTPRGSDYILDLEVNSPDLNGDRTVDLSDISIFAEDVESYAFRSDFNFDGKVDLSDISLFSSWVGEDCP